MKQVTRADVCQALSVLGVQQGDTVLVHSSFKSLGPVDGGAETVISGFLDAIGEEGTLVFPTFCQKDFRNVYQTWHLDKESDVGWLTNYFRKRDGSIRSDQATHSVAACGRDAYELTRTHGITGKRFGNMGDTPFAKDSPWEKMYLKNAKIVLLGVSPLYITFRHYAEYCYIDECLLRLQQHAEYEEMKAQLAEFGKKGVWPHLDNMVLADILASNGAITTAKCGDAELLCVSTVSFVDTALLELRSFNEQVLKRSASQAWDTDAWICWTQKLRDILNEN